MNNEREWRIRPADSNPTFEYLYGSLYNTTFTSIQLHHGGKFTATPNRDYVKGKITIVDYVKVKKLSTHLLSETMNELNIQGEPRFYGFEQNFGIDLGLIRLQTEDDFEKYYNKIFPFKCNQIHRIYVEVDGRTPIAFFPNSLKKADARVIELIVKEFVQDHPRANVKQAGEYVFEVFGVKINEWNLTRGFEAARRATSVWSYDDF